MTLVTTPFRLPSKSLSFHLGNTAQLARIGKALSSPERLEILQYLSQNPAIISQVSAHCGLPLSSAAHHLRILEDAGLILIHSIPASQGSKKICFLTASSIFLSLLSDSKQSELELLSEQSMPIGNYFDYQVTPFCGLVSDRVRLAPADDASGFCAPNRIHAQLIWMAMGYLEYRFSNKTFANSAVKHMVFSMELCSEFQGSRNDWPSDISVWINGKEIGQIHSPGDYGDRRGRLTPEWWSDSQTQYGDLWWISITEQGCYINEVQVSDDNLDTLGICTGDFVLLRIGVKPDAEHCGGFNLFGHQFGDYPQDIVMSVYGYKNWAAEA